MPPTPGPSPTVTIQEPPTPDWPPVPQPPATLDPNERPPWLLLRELEQRCLEEKRTNFPNLDEIEEYAIYWAATTHPGVASIWFQGYSPTGSKNWFIPAGMPETGIFRMQYEGDWVTCMAFSNLFVFEIESSGRIFIAQWGGYILAECYPGTSWEVPK